jgi:hypothetical protein
MNRFRSYFPLDDAPQPWGDGAFIGVDMLRDPGQLADGMVSFAENARFDEGVAAPRLGIRKLNFGAQGYQGDSPDVIHPYPELIDGQTFQDPISGGEWLIIATVDGLFRTRPGQRGVPITLPAGETVPRGTRLIQTYNGMVMLRGAGLDPLYMADLDVGFQPLPTPAVGKQALPPAVQGLYFSNRLFVVDARPEVVYRDTIFVSDIGAVTSVLQGDAVLNQFKINQGSADPLVAAYKFNDTTLIAAKASSIYVVSNIYGDNATIATNARLDLVTSEYGCRAADSFVQVGKDVWFLAHRRGIASIVQTETNALQGVDVPVSQDIQPLIDRINWEWAGDAVSAAWRNRVYVAVPLDNSRVNDAVLVYNTATRRWSGVDRGPAIRGVVAWVKFTYGGEIRLGFLSSDGFLNLYEDGFHDHVGDNAGAITYQGVPFKLHTRGYGGAAAGTKQFQGVRMALTTWWPQYTIQARVDGVREQRSVKAPGTADRTRYSRPHNAARYVTTNANDDFHVPYREDYSVDTAVAVDPGDAGISPDLHQEIELSAWLREQGRWVQFILESTRGRCELRGVLVDNRRGSVRDGTRT